MSRKERRKQASLGRRGGAVVVAPEIARGWQALQGGRLAEAEALARQTLARNPNDADGLNLLGQVAIRAGHRDAGLDLVRRALAAAPKRADLHFGLGQALQAVGKPAEAEAAYAAGLKADPGAAAAHNDRGLILLALGRAAEAEAEFAMPIGWRPPKGQGFFITRAMRLPPRASTKGRWSSSKGRSP
ncbi:MAG: tetratricopeptide repeat protein [Alphaproteobacteria bacterium]